MSAEATAVLREYVDGVFNRKDGTVIDATVAPDAVDHAGLPGQPPGIEGFRLILDAFSVGFPDLHLTIEDLFGSEDRAVVRWSATATHSGELMGIPATGKHVTMTGMDIVRVADGKIAELWAQIDMAGLMAQLMG